MTKHSKEEIQKYFWENDGMAKALEITVEEVGEGYSVVSMPIKDMHLNGLRTTHGGAVFTLADIAFGVACVGAGYCCVTAQSSLSFLNTGTKAPIRATCEKIKLGRSLFVYTLSVHDGSGKLLAQGQMTGYKLGTFEELLEKIEAQKKTEKN